MMWLPILVLTLSVGRATAFSSGRIGMSCGDMFPRHHQEPRTDPPPYTITVDKSTVLPGDHITVSLAVSPSSSTFFTGFLIEARDAGKPHSPAVGSFILLDPAQAQLLRCGHTQGSGVSHRGSSKKTEVRVMWKSPKSPPKKVQFLVTVVRVYEEYWVKMAGPVVSLIGATASPTPTAPAETTSLAALSSAFSSTGCGSTKSCLTDPAGCHPQSDPRCFFLSFATEKGGTSVMFELSGPAEGYVSFALSLDKWMGNDDVYLCVRDGNSIIINAAFVSGRTPPEPEAEEALWGRAWRLADGVIQCRFRRDNVLPLMENRFNLNQSYFLFLAHGRAHDGFVLRHNRQPLISTYQKVISGPPEDLSGSRSPLLIKIHGVLMMSAWMWIVSAAVLIARHFKLLYPDSTLLGQRYWFQLHRSMMGLAVILTAVAFILPFVYRGGWSKRAGSHPYIGCVVMALSIIQLIMAALRPAPDSPRRIYFNWMHLVAGTAAQILAVVSVFQGVQLQALLLPSPWSPGVLIGWLLWILLADLLLLILRRSGKKQAEDKEMILSTQFNSPQHEEVSNVNKLVLVVFLIGSTGFMVALVIAVASV